MEMLKGEFFIPLFKVGQTISPFSRRSNKQDSLLVANMYRDNFPHSYSRCKTLEAHWDNTQSIRHPAVSSNDNSKQPELSFTRLQLSEEEFLGLQKRTFGRYVAREAVLDEEYWMAAWLRAESNFEALSHVRYRHPQLLINTNFRNAHAFKIKYADQEYDALKKRRSGKDGNLLKSFCLVAVKKEDKNIKRTVLSSVVATMDLSIRQYWHGEKYPGEVKRQSGAVLASKEPNDAHKYGYVSNVCVAKFARRRGIASNMLCLASDMAASEGMKNLFVHVDADNHPAKELYTKTGFELVSFASSDKKLLMVLEL